MGWNTPIDAFINGFSAATILHRGFLPPFTSVFWPTYDIQIQPHFFSWQIWISDKISGCQGFLFFSIAQSFVARNKKQEIASLRRELAGERLVPLNRLAGDSGTATWSKMVGAMVWLWGLWVEITPGGGQDTLQKVRRENDDLEDTQIFVERCVLEEFHRDQSAERISPSIPVITRRLSYLVWDPYRYTWNPKQHVFNGRLVISTHFSCKDLESSDWNNHFKVDV